MRKDKKNAIQLRKLGKSYSQIKSTLGIPKSTLSDWLNEVGWSQKVKYTLAEKAKEDSSVRFHALNKIRKKHLIRLYRTVEKEAKVEFESFKLHPLFIAGMTIHWGEGDKLTQYQVRVGNTDPRMIRVFVKFLYEVCNVPRQRVHAHLLLYPDLDPILCKNYWIKKSSLSQSHFRKSVTIEGRHKTRRLPYGVCYITVNSTYLKRKVNTWLQLLSKDLTGKINYSRE
jgi:hypothetical protein